MRGAPPEAPTHCLSGAALRARGADCAPIPVRSHLRLVDGRSLRDLDGSFGQRGISDQDPQPQGLARARKGDALPTPRWEGGGPVTSCTTFIDEQRRLEGQRLRPE